MTTNKFAAYFDYDGRGDKFMTIDADTLEQAIEVAKESQKAGSGSVEIGSLGHVQGPPMLGMGDQLHVAAPSTKMRFAQTESGMFFYAL